MNQPYPLHYISADGPEPDATWSVYREVYADVHDTEPVEALTLHIGSYATEARAQAEAERLQAEEQVSEARMCAHCDRTLSARDESDELCTDCQAQVSESRMCTDCGAPNTVRGANDWCRDCARKHVQEMYDRLEVSETRIDVSTDTPVKFNNKLEVLP